MQTSVTDSTVWLIFDANRQAIMPFVLYAPLFCVKSKLMMLFFSDQLKFDDNINNGGKHVLVLVQKIGGKHIIIEKLASQKFWIATSR